MHGLPPERLLNFTPEPQTLPQGFIVDRESEAVVDREMGVYKQFKKIYAGDVIGFRFKLGPIIIDQFVGDREPIFDATKGPPRRVTWQRTIRQDVPAGWNEHFVRNILKRSGYTTLDGTPDYDKTWIQHARRHKRQWLKQSEWEIREVALQPFLEAYWKSPKDPVLKSMFKHFLKKKIEAHGALMHLAAAVRKADPTDIGAGFAFLDVPEVSQSIHTISFVQERAKNTSAGTGLIDYWFQHGTNTGLRFLHFGNFWAPGCPSDWIGFSDFKSQFGVKFIEHPNALGRWAGSWKHYFGRA